MLRKIHEQTKEADDHKEAKIIPRKIQDEPKEEDKAKEADNARESRFCKGNSRSQQQYVQTGCAMQITMCILYTKLNLTTSIADDCNEFNS